MDERPSIDLKGIVIAAEWAPDGDVTAVDIAGYDEKRYRIADDSRGRQLRRLVKRKVVMRGRLVRENQRDLFFVEAFRIDAD